ncbi:MAG: energy transducer TonB [Candidatus Gastranaerophilaceae bacterium]
MGIFDENNFIEISQDDVKEAKLAFTGIKEEYRKRVFANVLGGNLGIKFLKSININATNSSSLYTIPAVLKDIDISDIKAGNIKIDVRIVNNENILFVPKSQFEFGVTPDIYIFIKISEDLSTAQFLGAISPDEINKDYENDNYYFVKKETLYNENSLKKVLSEAKPKSNITISEEDFEKADSMLIAFNDGDLLPQQKHFLYTQLEKSEDLCNKIRDFEHFEIIAKDLAQTDEILSDSVLDILGAQRIYKDEMSNEVIGSDINLDEISNQTANDFIEDFVDDTIEENNIMDNIESMPQEELKREDDEVLAEMPGELEELPNDENLANLSINDMENFSDISNETANGFEFSEQEADSNAEMEEFSTDEAIMNFETENTEQTSENEIIDLNDFSTIDDKILENQEGLDDFIVEDITDKMDNLPELKQFEDLDDVRIDAFETTTETEMQTIDENSNTSQETDNTFKLDMSVKGDITDLEAYERPIDLTLPVLKPDANLPINTEENDDNNDTDKDSEIAEETQLDEPEDFSEAPANDNANLIDENEKITEFETVESLPTDNTEFQEVLDDETLNPDDNSEELPIMPTEESIIDNTEDSLPVVENSIPIENSNDTDEDDMSGLEEFTMDMAAAVEQANPNLNNPQIPEDIQQFDPFSGFSSDSGFNNNINEASPSENIQQPQQQQTEQMINRGNINDINIDDLDNNEPSNMGNLGDINIDDINIDDINIDDINIDDIDLNDPSIQNIDLGLDDNLGNINNIPNENVGNTQEYNPNFANNDQRTIEALYDNNQATQNPGEGDAIDKTMNNIANNKKQKQTSNNKKKSSPLMGVLLIVLLIAFGYMKKDLIIEKINANKGVDVQQDQNLPIEGETPEDRENNNLLDGNNQSNTPVGEIPGEKGGPQTAEQMKESLEQATASVPEPLSSSSIKRLYWEIPEELTYNDSIVNYLKIIGKTMKLSMQSDLLNVTEMPYSPKMIVDIQINKNGDVSNINTTISSGSKQVDSIVLQSVKAALKYVKAPTAEFKQESYNFSLIINF